MQITEINGHYAKLSPNTITVKDDQGKTRGIVHATCWKNLPPRETSAWFKTLRSSGLWGNPRANVATNVYMADGQLYWLYNTNADDYYLANVDKLRDTDLRLCHEKDAALIAQVEASPVTVIRYKAF